jgi:threonylcarbamoyladenosine tRNA methylthiotransferase MtaB
VAGSKRFVPHFHIPLQSGSNEILGLMKRRYKRELYVDRVAQIRRTMPNACIGVDVIVGFPGETEAHFLETYQFLNELDISYLHVFTYSERANTEAAKMKGKVQGGHKSDRSKMLHILSEKKRRAFYENQIGKMDQVLFEAAIAGGQMEGFTRNYVKVKAAYDPLWINAEVNGFLNQIDSDGTVVFTEFRELNSTNALNASVPVLVGANF